MLSKTRLRQSLDHVQPDKVPVDFGGTLASGMHITCVAALRDHYGLDRHPVKVIEPFQMLGEIEEDLKQIIGVDTEPVNPKTTFFGFTNDRWKEWRLDNGLPVLVPGDFVTTEDAAGNHYIYPGGDIQARPSGRMPRDGYYFDAVIRQPEIDDDHLNPDDNLEEFKHVSDDDLKYFQASISQASETGRGVIVNFGGTGLGDIALVPGTSIKNPKGIRDVEEWYVSTVTRQDYIHQVFDRQTDIAVENLRKFKAISGDAVDAVFICGTDFGTQTGTFCSRQTFLDLYMPYYKKVNRWIHENTRWKTFKHCCGAVETFMDLFIEAGFDIMNPVQCSAAGMDPATLKRKYGDKITFWGGGVDTQKVLPFGTTDEVRRQVLDRCRIFSGQGGFVFGAIHNIQARTPVQNIVAMIDAVKEFNSIMI